MTKLGIIVAFAIFLSVISLGGSGKFSLFGLGGLAGAAGAAMSKSKSKSIFKNPFKKKK